MNILEKSNTLEIKNKCYYTDEPGWTEMFFSALSNNFMSPPQFQFYILQTEPSPGLNTYLQYIFTNYGLFLEKCFYAWESK